MAEQIAIGGDWRGTINAFMTDNEINDTGWQTGGIVLKGCKVANEYENSKPKYRLVKLGKSKLLFIQASLSILAANATVTLPTEASVGTDGIYTIFVGGSGLEWELKANVLSITGNNKNLDLTKIPFAAFYHSFVV